MNFCSKRVYIQEMFLSSKEYVVKKIVEFLRKISGHENDPGKWFKWVVAVVLTVVLGAALLAFIVDPHYRYRLPRFYDTVFYEAYATAPRLLSDYEYDLLMLGSSMARNYYIDDIEKAFGGKALKISAAGASSYDLKKLFDTAVDAKGDKLKRVIYLLDIYAINKTLCNYKEFENMYDKDHWRDYRYLFGRQTFSSMIYLVKRKLRPKGKRALQAIPNLMFSTEHKKTRYSKAEVISSTRSCEKTKHRQNPCRAGYEAVLKSEILNIFDDHPEIEFTVIVPPYSLYAYCLSERFGEADDLLKQKTAVLKEILKRKNVRVFDFQCDEEIVCNWNYFTDIQHYSSGLARRILNWVVNGQFELRTPEDIERNEAALRKLVKDAMPQFYNDIGKKM